MNFWQRSSVCVREARPLSSRICTYEPARSMGWHARRSILMIMKRALGSEYISVVCVSSMGHSFVTIRTPVFDRGHKVSSP